MEKLGDYSFKLEFKTEVEKSRVLEGGPWRHKGDALIIVHYDGLTRSSEVSIISIGLWIRLYDLPLVMMKEGVARHLCRELGEFIKMDGQFLGYMCIRVQYPLRKALVLLLRSR
jgi:hypothetical protein